MMAHNLGKSKLPRLTAMTLLSAPLRKSIATVTLSGSLPQKLQAAADAGFDGVEIFEDDLLQFPGTPAEIRRMAGDLGLQILLYQPLRDVEAMPGGLSAAELARAQRKFDAMEQLGVGLALVCSNVQGAALDDPARAADDLRVLADAAARRGLRLGYEALAWGRHVRRWRQAWDIVERAAHPALGLMLDSFHTLALGDTLHGLDTVPAERIFFVQLADAPRLSLDVRTWSRHHRNFPGQGDLPVVGFTRAVLGAGYRGPLSLEVFNDAFRAAPPLPVAQDGRRSLEWLEAVTNGGPLAPAARAGGTALAAR
ncbi:3-keto-5-aminohexanoate cleavage protein (fragment) [Cupriavidus neocaledonicus]|uniref:3-keto-5-aminohexanoate cleavage protein n=1 Tax=Cupriavidus neocaledonicus TaxID=1040979 RepID=A0ABY1V944_9BURK